MGPIPTPPGVGKLKAGGVASTFRTPHRLRSEQLASEQLESHRLSDAWHFGLARIRCGSCRRKLASNDCASKAQEERQGMKRAVSGFTRPPVKSPMHWL